MIGKLEDYITQRAIDSAIYTIKNKSTIRETARYIGVSKTTTHKDLKERLPKINQSLYQEVNKVLETNENERHIRGGIATKEMLERMKWEI